MSCVEGPGFDRCGRGRSAPLLSSHGAAEAEEAAAAATAAAVIGTTTSLETKTDSDVKPRRTGPDARLASFCCVNGQVLIKVAVENPTSQCGLKCNTARMGNCSELETDFFFLSFSKAADEYKKKKNVGGKKGWRVKPKSCSNHRLSLFLLCKPLFC